MAADRTVAIYESGDAPGGYDATYTGMVAMEAGEDADLTAGGGTRLLVEITDGNGDWSGNPDQEADGVTFAGWTYDRGNGEYIHIYTLSDCRSATGNWETTGYIFEYTGNGEGAINLGEASAIDFTGVQFETSDTTEWATKTIYDLTAAVAHSINVYKCIHTTAGLSTNSYPTIYDASANATGTWLFQNCVFFNAYHGPKGSSATLTMRTYNCTIYDMDSDAWEEDSWAAVVKNTVVGGSGDDWQDTLDTYDYCSSDDGEELDVNHVDLSPTAGPEDELGDHHLAWTDPDASPPDFTIKGIDSVLYHAGLDQDSDPFVPSDDIIGTTRPVGAAQVSIGAFEVVAVLLYNANCTTNPSPQEGQYLEVSLPKDEATGSRRAIRVPTLTSYVHLYFRLVSGLSAGNSFKVGKIVDVNGDNVAYVVCENDGGTFKLRAEFYDANEIGDFHVTSTETISEGNWYLLEPKYDIANLLAEFRVGGVTIGTADTLVTATRIPKEIQPAATESDEDINTLVFGIDDIQWDTDDWVGVVAGLSIPIAMYHHMHH